MSKYFTVFTIAVFFSSLLLGDQRRIGKRHQLDWSEYYNLGKNYGIYSASEQYPDLSVVGALISNNGALGTATLIAPNFVITAAHVVKNDFFETVDPNEWKFFLHHDFAATRSASIYQIESIIVHPAWIARQTRSNSLGDGDELGVDLAIAKLDRPVSGVYPARLPSEWDEPLSLRAVLAGFGSLVEGNTGSEDTSNSLRVGGENTIDRSVAKVTKAGVSVDELGGLLAVDFDSGSSGNNTLSSNFQTSNSSLLDARNILGSGESSGNPLSLEASTAVGDSGGPAFVHTTGYWRVHGVVSYGTTDSSYGDVTIYTRLATHHDWLMNQLPDWPDSKIIDESGWLQNPWLGTLLPVSGGWSFHVNFGWIYTPYSKGNSFWSWSILLNKWVWLSDQSFPFFYCYSPSRSFWLYVLIDSSNGESIRAYNYLLKSWVTYAGS